MVLLGLGFLWTSAQDDNDHISTIFSKGKKNGGYGAISLGFTQIGGKDAFLMGARGSWIINHSFAIGLGGCGFVNDANYHYWRNNQPQKYLAGGYGGIYLEPIVAPRLPAHLSFPVLLGIGGISNIDNQENWDNLTFDNLQNDVFLVLEPSVELEFNMSRHLRVAGTFGYRFTSKIEIENIDPQALKGANVGLIFKFGKF